MRLLWHKRSWRGSAATCAVGSFTEIDDRIAPARSALTARAARWATRTVGREARPAAEVAAELGCDWQTLNQAMLARGEARWQPTATGSPRWGHWASMRHCSGARAPDASDSGAPQSSTWPKASFSTLSQVATLRAPTRWLLAQPQSWRDGIDWGVLDLSGAYRRTFQMALPQARQVADPFHVVRLANNGIDEVRRRVQNDTLGHCGRKHDPLYRARRPLVPLTNAPPTAATPGSAACYEPTTPAGRSSPISLPAEIQRASMADLLGPSDRSSPRLPSQLGRHAIVSLSTGGFVSRLGVRTCDSLTNEPWPHQVPYRIATTSTLGGSAVDTWSPHTVSVDMEHRL